MKEIIKELSISVACLLDDADGLITKDVEHIQDLVPDFSLSQAL